MFNFRTLGDTLQSQIKKVIPGANQTAQQALTPVAELQVKDAGKIRARAPKPSKGATK
ncbi:hypothetical protein UFOVP641_38 [uncultured Caudovirales phage]|uniref:Uncharacterized protein n=1 Tax=uncultured Caudovirales phage TaxID=2100421 RepID=A0A6J5N499_9CAUD|nr:hypothetical protein UFOVP641_38 [uncultured Caudovirales phage]